MIFRQLFEPRSSTYTYLLACPQTRQGLLIDPVLETFERDRAVLAELKLTLSYTVETHVHADHLTSARKFKALTGSQVAGPAVTKLACYDVGIEHREPLTVGTIALIPLFTPGHTDHHFSFLVEGGTHQMVFTGDALLIDGCGRTDFQSGDATALYRGIHENLFNLPGETLVYPGHDYSGHWVSSIAQEKARNPRLGASKPLDQFVEIMRNLNLPKPRMMDFAVPGNETCGQCPPNVPPELKAPCEIEEKRQG